MTLLGIVYKSHRLDHSTRPDKYTPRRLCLPPQETKVLGINVGSMGIRVMTGYIITGASIVSDIILIIGTSAGEVC